MYLLYIDHLNYKSGKIDFPTSGHIEVVDFSCAYTCGNFKAIVKIDDNISVWNKIQPIKNIPKLAVKGKPPNIEILVLVTEDDYMSYRDITDLGFDCPLMLTIAVYDEPV